MPTRTNLEPNPKVETDLTGWAQIRTGGLSRVPVSTFGPEISHAAEATATADSPVIRSSVISVTPGQHIVLLARAEFDGTPLVSFSLDLHNSSGAWAASSGGLRQQAPASGTIDLYSFVTVPDGIFFLYPYVFVHDAGYRQTFRASRVLVEQAWEGYPDYFDGDTEGAEWSGTPNASTSTMDVPIWPIDTRRYAHFDRGPYAEPIIIDDADGLASELVQEQAAYPNFVDADAASHGPFGASFYLPGTDRHSYFTVPAKGEDFEFRGYLNVLQLPTNGDRVWDLNTDGIGWETTFEVNADGSLVLKSKDHSSLAYTERGSTAAFAANQWRRVIVDVRDGIYLTVRVWTTNVDGEQAPDYEWSVVLSGNLNFIRVGNLYNDGSIVYWDSLAVARSGSGEEQGLVGPFSWDGTDKALQRNAWVGAVTDTSAQIKAHDPAPLSLHVGTDPAVLASFGDPVAPNTDSREITFNLPGLDADTRYYWELRDEAETVHTGQFRTHPLVGEPASFKFSAASCAGLEPLEEGRGDVYLHHRISNYDGHLKIRDRAVANDHVFFVHLGDMVYYNPSQSNPYSVEFLRKQWDEVLQQPNQAALYRDVPLFYAWDDHDYGPNDSNRDSPSRLNVQQAYRDKVPHYPLQAPVAADGSQPIYQSVEVGRVLFILSDVRSDASPDNATDDASKTMLGAAQKAWMRETLENTNASFFIWLTPTPFLSAGGNWSLFTTEATELVQMFTDTGWIDKMIAIGGDFHHMGIDDGTSGIGWGGIPSVTVSGLDSRTNTSTLAYSHGAIGAANRGQHVEMEITDTGDILTVTAHGYTYDGLWQSVQLNSVSAPREVEQQFPLVLDTTVEHQKVVETEVELPLLLDLRVETSVIPVAPPPSQTVFRIIAQDVKSGEFLNWNLPLSDVKVDFAETTEITGTLEPEYAELNMDAYSSWSTWLHLEQDGVIRASGILQPLSLSEESVTIAATSPSGYAHGIPFLDEFSGIQVDPMDMVRLIWDHIQSYEDGDIGLVIDDTTSPIKIGTEKQDVSFETDEGEQVEFQTGEGPYNLNWWEHIDCGEEISNLANDTPFDMRDEPQWNSTKTLVQHFLRLGYPRLGNTRDNLRFVQGENVTNPVPLTEAHDMFATEVIVLGAGKGRERVRGVASNPNPKRLRRPVVLEDKGITSNARAQRVARDELKRRQVLISMQEITVDTQHPNAKLGSFQVGDDILVTGDFPYLGWVSVYHRITGYTWVPADLEARLRLKPSESFTYGPLEEL